jgi:hypothetical protein
MGNPVLPLMRLRLELDKTLRTRQFVSRSFRGGLLPDSYLDLVSQLAALAEPSGDETLLDSAASELGTSPPAPCFAARLFQGAIRAAGLPTEDVAPSILAALGTSWLISASNGCRAVRRGTFLEELCNRGHTSLLLLQRELRAEEADRVHAIAEIARGAMLGVATYLDETWPPPVLLIEFSPS